MRLAARILFWGVAALMTLAWSCAKEEKISKTEIEQISLDAWMTKYHSGDASMVRHDNGMYTQVLQAAPAGAAEMVAGYWAEIIYTGYSLPELPMNTIGNVFVTRDSLTASIEGSTTTAYQIHYAPQKVYVSPYYSVLNPAMYQTLMLMKEGEKRRVYAPSSLTYGSTGTSSSTFGAYGYQGSRYLSGSVPSYMDIELVRVIADVNEDQYAQVDMWAASKMGYIDPTDTLMSHFFLTITPEDASADSIISDSVIKIWYVGKFMDGFIFDTNIDSIALKYLGDTSTHTAWEFQPSENPYSSSSSSSSEYTNGIPAFSYATLKMTYDSWGEMVFSSEYGYGSSGNTPTSSGGTEIDPYTPLYFKFYIDKKPVDD